MKYFYGSSYLPPNEFSDGFIDLMSIAPDTVSVIYSQIIFRKIILTLTEIFQ
jgi:hypothetical protein